MAYSPGALGQFALGQGSSGGGAHVLSVALSTYAVTCNAATLKKTKQLHATVGAFVVTPHAASLRVNHAYMLITRGVFSVSGKAATLGVHAHHMLITRGVFSVSGKAVTLVDHNRSFPISTGVFTVTGHTASLTDTAHRMPATKGLFAVSQNAVKFVVGRHLKATVGVINIAGHNASANHVGRATEIETVGVFHVTGNPAAIGRLRIMHTTVRTFAVTGVAVTLRKHHSSFMSATPGTYYVSAVPLTLVARRHRVLAASTVAFVITRRAATLGRVLRLVVAARGFVVTTHTVALHKGRTLHPVTGGFAITTRPATLAHHGHMLMPVTKGTFAVTGYAIKTNHWQKEIWSTKAITVTGNAAGLHKGRHISAATGVFTLTGKTVIFHDNNPRIIAKTGVFTLTGNDAATVRPVNNGISDGFRVLAAVNPGIGVLVKSIIGMGSFSLFRYRASGNVIDTATMSVTLHSLTEYRMTAHDTAQMAAIVHSSYVEQLMDAVGVTAATKAIQAVRVLDKLTAGNVYVTMSKYGLTMREMVTLASHAIPNLGGGLNAGVAMGDQVAYDFLTYASASDRAMLYSLLGPRVIFTLTSADTVDLSATDALKMVFSGKWVDTVQIDITYLAPAGGFTTWAINTRNNAVSEYRNYTFTSFAKLGNRYVAASKDGVYELIGDTDDGVAIPTQLGGGFFQPGGAFYTAFKAAYLGMAIKTNVPGVFLKLVTGDGSEYLYTVNPMDRMTARVQFGKGLRSRYYAFELVTNGADYDFDSIEFVPLVSARRFS